MLGGKTRSDTDCSISFWPFQGLLQRRQGVAPSRYTLLGMSLRPIFLMLALGALSSAQQPPPSPLPALPNAAPATVTYAVESERRDPPRFSLAVDLTGHASYLAGDAPAAGAESELPYR